MTIHVAFLRAINVGGRRVSMDRLRRPFEDLGLEDVSTFIASGNVIFDGGGKTAELESKVEAALEEALGFQTTTFIRPLSRIAKIIETDPFSVRGSEDLIHVGFLRKPPAATVRKRLEELSNDVDTVTTAGKELYWLARGGMGRATISGAILERALGQPTTMRSMKMLRRLHSKFA